MPLDYSKWNHIEISDDEDDTHPNIDTPSLFRWRHQARVERMEESKREKEAFQDAKTKVKKEIEDLTAKLKEIDEKSSPEKYSEIKKALAEAEKKQKAMNDKESELTKKERLTPLNIDTICHDGKSKTIINKGQASRPNLESEGDIVDRLRKFVEKNEALIKKFGMYRRPDDSQAFLLEHPHLVCEETANHLVIWCVDLCIEEKLDLMKHVAHQTISMQFILELAKSMKMDPRACVRPFYRKFKDNDPQYMQGFNDELEAFIKRVHVRAEARVEEYVKKHEEEERQKRLGPGGLDPVEVMESLPETLQKCFESRDTEQLKEVIAAMDPEDAKYHMKRCVDSGLWVPGPGVTFDDDNDEEKKVSESEEKGEAEEEVYDEIKDDTKDKTDA